MLYSNKGKVMRLCAQGIAACGNQPEFKKREFTSLEKTYFQQVSGLRHHLDRDFSTNVFCI
jgi:hypothetical protein